MKMSLNNIAQEYFSNLNSMAARICVDMNETKAAYDNLWTKLTEEEKNQILTESIIKPEISLKYDVVQNNAALPNHYGAKLVVDDTCSYRDEHSAPFSFRTQSQRDLTLFQGEKRLKQKTNLVPKSENRQAKGLKILMNKVEDEKNRNEVDVTHDIPRTGLDLLDNW